MKSSRDIFAALTLGAAALVTAKAIVDRLFPIEMNDEENEIEPVLSIESPKPSKVRFRLSPPPLKRNNAHLDLTALDITPKGILRKTS